MAKIRPGGLVGQISGSIGGDTFSRNRGGSYVRTRAIPTKSTTTYAMQAKNRLAFASARWQSLTASERRAWENFATNRTITDRMGEQIALSGQQTYVSLNARLERSGDTLIDEPPARPSPDGFLDLDIAADIGAGDFQLTFSPEPDENQRVWVWAAVVHSAGIEYVQNLLKLVTISEAQATSPLEIQTDVEERFGELSAGQLIHVQAQLMDTRTGLVSGVRRARAVIEETEV